MPDLSCCARTGAGPRVADACVDRRPDFDASRVAAFGAVLGVAFAAAAAAFGLGPAAGFGLGSAVVSVVLAPSARDGRDGTGSEVTSHGRALVDRVSSRDAGPTGRPANQHHDLGSERRRAALRGYRALSQPVDSAV